MSKQIILCSNDAAAVLEERKTATRLVMHPQPKFGRVQTTPGKCPYAVWADSDGEHQVHAPYDIGDIVAVKETWAELINSDGTHKRYVYASTDEYPFGESGYIAQFRWHSSADMPKEAARIFIRVTDVQAVRLQDEFGAGIDAIRAFQQEGIRGCLNEECCKECAEDNHKPHCTDDSSGCGMLEYGRDKFSRDWDSKVLPQNWGMYTWDANPWVWKIVFEKCEKTKGETLHGKINYSKRGRSPQNSCWTKNIHSAGN